MKPDEKDPKPDEAKTMALRTLSPAARSARIAELEAELELLKAPPFVEYPKMLADGRIVQSAKDEAVPVKEPEPVKAAHAPAHDDPKKAKH